MRAYLIAGDGAEPGIVAADALVIDGRTGRAAPSLRAEGEAIQGRRADGPSAALGRFAALAMTRASEGRATRLLLHVDDVCSPDLDAGLAAAALLHPDAIVLPASHGRDVAHLGARLAVLEAEHGLTDGGIGIVALLTDAAGVLAAGSFAGASPRLRGLGWDAQALAAELGLPQDWPRHPASASHPLPHPEVPASADLEGGLQPAARSPESSFEARLRFAPQDEGAGRTIVARSHRWEWSPVLAQARAAARLAAAAAGVEAIEAAFPGADAEGLSAHVVAARRDGFGAMFACDLAQAQVIRTTA